MTASSAAPTLVTEWKPLVVPNASESDTYGITSVSQAGIRGATRYDNVTVVDNSGNSVTSSSKTLYINDQVLDQSTASQPNLGDIAAVNDQNDVVVTGTYNATSQLTTGAYFKPSGGDKKLFLPSGSDTGLLPTIAQAHLRNIYPFQMSNRMTPAGSSVQPVLHILFKAEVERTPVAWSPSTVFLLRLLSDGTTDLHEVTYPDGVTSPQLKSINSSGVISAIGNGGSSDKHALLLAPAQVKRVWSDQLPGVEANYLADARYNDQDSVGTGNDDKKYIFMGAAQSNNFDKQAHIKALVEIPGPDWIRNKILWRIRKTTDNASTGSLDTSTYQSYGVNTYIVTINKQSIDDNDAGEDYSLIGGVDINGNGTLDDIEQTIHPKCLYRGTRLPFAFKIVLSNCYNNSLTALQRDANAWYGQGLVHARNLLNAFLVGSGPSEATSSESITIDRLESGLDHPVGILFDASSSSVAWPAPRNILPLPHSGPGASITAVFGPSTQMASDVVNSETLRDWLRAKLNAPESVRKVRDYFTDHPNETSADFDFHFDSGAEGLDYNKTQDLDLWFAFGKVSLALGVSMTVDRAGFASGTTVTGSMNDLYDYNFDGAPAFLSQPAASVQAGYNTLGQGGRVFKSRVDMSDAHVNNFGFQFEL